MKLLLLVLGAFAVYLIQVFLCRIFWKHKLSAKAYFSVRQATEGDTIKLTEVLENRKLIPVATVKVNVAVELGLEFLDHSNLVVSDKNYRSEIFALRSYERVIRDIPLMCKKRGFFTIDGIDLIGNDLFYSKRFLNHQNLSSAVCVYPGQADSRQLFTAAKKIMGEYVVKSADCDDPFTFRGIRPYQSYDAMKDINWKASAKTGELRVNVHEYTSDQEICILLDTEWDMLLRPDDLLEESIRIAASMAEEFIGAGIPTALCTNGKDTQTGIPFRIKSGADFRHTDAIRAGLAKISLPAQKNEESILALIREMSNKMNARLSHRISYVFISTQVNKRVAAAWDELAARAIMAHWIIPVHTKDDVPFEMEQNKGRLIWEVPYGK